jgi:hypothetical protein
MPNFLKKWSTLPTKHKRIVCRLWGSFVYWHLIITYLPFRLWKHHIADTPHQLTDMPISEVRRLIKLSESVGRHHFIKVNCLRRCMVQKSLLNRIGISNKLIIGVKKSQQNFAAHCWLTHQNQVINDSLDSTNEYIALEKIENNTANIFKHF